MAVKSKSSRKVKRPLIKMICTNCKNHTVHTRKNPTNTPDRIEMKRYCPNPKCKGHFLFKETK